ncbi:MAG: DUF2096 family protein [Candidatus Bathyarchaeia archaeon]
MLNDYNIMGNSSCDKLMTETDMFILQGAPMNWNARWKILSDVITDLCKRGERVPQNIINDMRSAKVMIEVIKADKSRVENIIRLEEYLGNVESYILSTAKNVFGENYLNNILRRLSELEAEGFTTEEPVRFRPGLPRGEKWIRIQVSDITPLEFVRNVASELNLKLRVEEDGYILVYGAEESLKTFAKRISEKARSLRRSLLSK